MYVPSFRTRLCAGKLRKFLAKALDAITSFLKKVEVGVLG